ncbi:unnamed protein product [Symbiodinium sp. CCMP2456]|nr:unnamed protein product [Symbiodinium sp. CCMP2456]
MSAQIESMNCKDLKLKFEEDFGFKPKLERLEEAGSKIRCRVTNARDLIGDSDAPWGEPRGTLSAAEVSALRQVFALVDGQRQRSHKPSSCSSYVSASSTPSPSISAPSRLVAELPPAAGPELLYRKGMDVPVPDEILDLVDAFEQAPPVRGALEVSEVYRANAPKHLQDSWKSQKTLLQDRNSDPTFPRAAWQDCPGTDDVLRREREEVAWQLLSMSHRHVGGVRSCRVYHGCPDWNVVCSICKTGFANVAKTSGWFGEGLYTTLHAPYALRYGLGMRDFWEKPGETGFVVAAKLIFWQVYPVTEADDTSDQQPGMKGKAIGRAEGARGCDCHFACVRGHLPQTSTATDTILPADMARGQKQPKLW